ncbi:hypothetical protein [Deferrisoma camini]|uniref:hypothetical protein n=1 Tax=Deferrisoma camini TaxID=1035120 RepID=UPI00046CF44D|nr:hypothetical protein [Deferrisoma camini]
MDPAADLAAWLREHAIECQRYRALISPSACRQHQVMAPDACHKCPRRTEPDPGRRTRFRVRSARRDRAREIREEERTMGGRGKTVTCRDCGQQARNQGSGLCPKCYSKHKRAGTLDRFGMMGVPQDETELVRALRHELDGARRQAEELRAEVEGLREEAQASAQRVAELEAELDRLRAGGGDTQPEPDDTRRLTLEFHTERDRRVMMALHQVAQFARRTPEAQAIHVLEEVLPQILHHLENGHAD